MAPLLFLASRALLQPLTLVGAVQDNVTPPKIGIAQLGAKSVSPGKDQPSRPQEQKQGPRVAYIFHPVASFVRLD